MPDQPTRVLRIITDLNISGATLQAVLLTAALNERGYDGRLVSGGSPHTVDSMLDLTHDYDVMPIMLPELTTSMNPLRQLNNIRLLVQLMRDEQPDIVHTHNMVAGFVGRIAARIAGVPVVVHTLHEYPFRGYYDRIRTVLFIYLERIGAYLSDSIITLSEGLRRELVDTYGITKRNRITVLPLGFDLDVFVETKRHEGDFRAEWNIPPDAPLIGTIGRLLPVKNHKLFLTVAAKIHEQLPDARFVIVGDGSERAALERLAASLGIADVVIFTGWQQTVVPIYSDLDVLVNSSWNEGTPVPLIEALAARCPVVSTNVGGVPDVLGHGDMGMLVPSGDADALCGAIMKMLQSPPAPDAMERAQQAMQRRYGIQRLADDMNSLYRGLLAKKGATTRTNTE